jgi:hypothetical protein
VPGLRMMTTVALEARSCAAHKIFR